MTRGEEALTHVSYMGMELGGDKARVASRAWSSLWLGIMRD